MKSKTDYMPGLVSQINAHIRSGRADKVFKYQYDSLKASAGYPSQKAFHESYRMVFPKTRKGAK